MYLHTPKGLITWRKRKQDLTGTTIDLTLATAQLSYRVKRCGPTDLEIDSDHIPITTDIDTQVNREDKGR